MLPSDAHVVLLPSHSALQGLAKCVIVVPDA